jgi:methylglyoxal/glyoxal reductase
LEGGEAMNSLHDEAILHNGVKMPWLGFGVWKVKDGEEVVQAVKTAIEVGYRHIDTAAVYKNEQGVGQAIKESGVPRQELFITTKVWNSDQGYDTTLKAFEDSLQKLGLDYVDLYLVHWPVKGKYKDTYRALEQLYKDGRVRAIGVCNFQIHHLEDLLADCQIKPMVNQVEYHPRLTQEELRSFCKQHGIQLEAWSPLMQGELLHDSTLIEIGKKYGKSPAQVILRWDLQNEVVTIPKSVTPHRIKENANIFDFELTAEDMEKINSLNKNERIGPDPDNFNF